jgi:hypothetical protein
LSKIFHYSSTRSWCARTACAAAAYADQDRIAPKNSSRSAALVNAGVDLRRAHLRLDVMDPAVVGDAGLGRAGEAEDRGGQSASDDGGRSEPLHFGAFFLLCVWHCVGRFGGSPCRSDLLNTVGIRQLMYRMTGLAR